MHPSRAAVSEKPADVSALLRELERLGEQAKRLVSHGRRHLLQAERVTQAAGFPGG